MVFSLFVRLFFHGGGILVTMYVVVISWASSRCDGSLASAEKTLRAHVGWALGRSSAK